VFAKEKDTLEFFCLISGFPSGIRLAYGSLPPSQVHFSALSNRIGKGNFNILKIVGV